MVWADIALVGVGAAAGVGASALQRRSERRAARRDRTDDQTRAALIEVAAAMQSLSVAAEQRDDDLDEQVAAAINVLRRQSLLVADPALRARVELARTCLEWNKAITASELGAGIVYITRYICGDLEPAIGAYLRHEPVPLRSERMNDCERVLDDAWATGEFC
jgi:predicted membrane-bound mannosyltransferase